MVVGLLLWVATFVWGQCYCFCFHSVVIHRGRNSIHTNILDNAENKGIKSFCYLAQAPLLFPLLAWTPQQLKLDDTMVGLDDTMVGRTESMEVQWKKYKNRRTPWIISSHKLQGLQIAGTCAAAFEHYILNFGSSYKKEKKLIPREGFLSGIAILFRNAILYSAILYRCHNDET